MWRTALRFSAVGLEMGIAVIVGYGAGWWLDRKFGTEPYLSIILLLFGIAAAFKAIYDAAKRASREQEQDGDDS